MSADYFQWVREGAIVEAQYGAGAGIHATGRVIAYTDRPTVTIETDDGRRVTWIADMCEPVSKPMWLAMAEMQASTHPHSHPIPAAKSEFWSNCRAEQHLGDIAYRCILAEHHDGPHGRLVPEPTWWTGNDAPDRFDQDWGLPVDIPSVE